MHTAGGLILMLALAVVAAGASALLVRLAMPLLRRYALARPNARSSHREPTPQGGGGPVVVVALALPLIAAGGFGGLPLFHAAIIAVALLIAVVGAVDDIHPLPAKLRLGLQATLVAGVLLAAPADWRLAPVLPLGLERILMLIAGVWFVNLTNFMDGIDGITVAEMVPVLLALAGLGGLSLESDLLALALAGALLGFLLFNRPPASVFLGDVGSLPIGLIVAALLFEAAATSGVIPALILPMYYLFDATQTLLSRLRAGENVFEAHRKHAYQNAVDGGWSAGRVDGAVVGLNLGLIGLAWLARGSGILLQVLLLAVAFALTLLLCRHFRRAKR